MENVKKCKNFLSTLIKLASTGKHSTETAASVRELVKDLLVSKKNTQETKKTEKSDNCFFVYVLTSFMRL